MFSWEKLSGTERTLNYVTCVFPLYVLPHAAVHFIFHLCHSTGNKVIRYLRADEPADMDAPFIHLWKRLHSNLSPLKKNPASFRYSCGEYKKKGQSEGGEKLDLRIYLSFLLYLNTSQVSEVWFKHVNKWIQNQDWEILTFLPIAPSGPISPGGPVKPWIVSKCDSYTWGIAKYRLS